jgi:hypothetical protein
MIGTDALEAPAYCVSDNYYMAWLNVVLLSKIETLVIIIKFLDIR